MTPVSAVNNNSVSTIASVATAPGVGGLSVIRVSGPRAHSVGRSLSGNPKKNLVPRYALYTPLVSCSGVEIDLGIITYFPSPNSYTGEEVVEVSCHGGGLIGGQVLSACYSFGCKPAQPGEFTRRAFLNGKMDLLQAESVAALIVSNSSLSKEANYQILSGQLSVVITKLKDSLLSFITSLEVELDFTEDEIAPLPTETKISKALSVLSSVKRLLLTYRTGKMLEGGACVVLVGKPNAGKSSLLNTILSEERAIVSKTPGTTRDAVEVPFLVKGFPLRFVDTAGIREGSGSVEQKGVRFTQQYIEKADLLIQVSEVFEGSLRVEHPVDVFSLPKHIPTIQVINKCDLLLGCGSNVETDNCFLTSALTGEGVDALLDKIHDTLVGGSFLSEEVVITSLRHKEALQRVERSLKTIICGLRDGTPTDALASDLRIAVSFLDELLGVTTADDILDNVFAKFCVGK